MINIVVAYDQNRAIGSRGDLPWGRDLPGDLQQFKQLTLGKTVVIGRNTWDSIPARLRPLPGRENIVLTRNPRLSFEGALSVSSLALAIKVASHEVFVIGGTRVFQEALPLATRVYATEVHHEFPEADVYMPELAEEAWVERSRLSKMRSHDSSGDQYDYDFVIYDRSS